MKEERIIKQKLIGEIPPLTSFQTKKLLTQLEKNICKIENKEKNSIATGFLCKIPFPNLFHLLPVLITTNHTFEKGELKLNKIIKITFNEDSISKYIKIDENRKIYSNETLDVSMIEIKPNLDKIKENSFLDIDEDALEPNYNNKLIYILQYPKGKSSHSIGKMTIKDKEIIHYCSTDFGSSGSPILNLESFKVIGVHIGGYKSLENNAGILIKYPIEDFIFKNFPNPKAKLKPNKSFVEPKITVPKKNIKKIKPLEVDNIKNALNEFSIFDKNNFNNTETKKIEDKKKKNEYDKISNKNKKSIKYINKNDKNKINFQENNENLKKNISNDNIIIKNGNNDENLYIIHMTMNSEYTISHEGNCFIYEKFNYTNSNDNLNYIDLFTTNKKLGYLNSSNTELFINNKKLDFAAYLDFISLDDIRVKLIIKTKITNMSQMFYLCTRLENITFSSFNTKNVCKMNLMFYSCYALKSLDLSSFDTHNVTDMSSMFEDCRNLVFLNISSFDTRKVNNMSKMFSKCKKIQKLDLSSFDMSNVKYYDYMFDQCYELKIIITKKKNSLFINKENLKDFVEANIKYI